MRIETGTKFGRYYSCYRDIYHRYEFFDERLRAEGRHVRQLQRALNKKRVSYL